MRDIYKQVTERIIAKLEAGVSPWKCPFARMRQLPYNAATGKEYQGTNVLLLWIEQLEHGYRSNGWLTFKQMLALGGRLKPKDPALGYQKGDQAGAMVIRVGTWTPKGAEPYIVDGEERTVEAKFLKAFTVFNLAQIEGLPDSMYEVPPIVPMQDEDRTEIDNLLPLAGIAYEEKPCVPCYMPALDKIAMPSMNWFKTPEDFYATKLHELTHATGHPKRLNRKLEIKGETSTVREARALEELCAEIGSAFLCAQFGIEGDLQHEEYIGDWIKALRAHPNALLSAAKKAQEAADWVMALIQPQERAA